MSNETSSIKFSNPAPLGLAGFALTTTLLSLINSGLVSGDGLPVVLACALAFGGTAQFFAGLCELPRGNTFGFTAFVSYGAFWWSFALINLLPHGNPIPVAFVGWYLVAWGVFSFYMWIATFRVPLVLWAIFLVLWITFFLLAAGHITGNADINHAGGFTGILTAVLAFYLSAAEVINDTFGRTVLWVGKPIAK
ncbi:MAG: acetate uptake transporter [Alphaproteobacteria bacterium]|nr:acetate uptake transporter [Alphaproteobacteria bacterium]